MIDRLLLTDLAKRLPHSAGIYRMVDDKGQILYVGKAKNLQNRVLSYARAYNLTPRLNRILQLLNTISYIQTDTEAEAILLEAQLIKQLQPRFNILLRDDKSFPYILITNHVAPAIRKYRGAKNRTRGEYFGPFASSSAVKNTIKLLQKAFLIRTCPDRVYANRHRPCILHEIKRCAAPCTGEIKLADYNGLVSDTRDFLAGQVDRIRCRLAAAMDEAASSYDFEQAALCRDRLTAISHIMSCQNVDAGTLADTDVLAITSKNKIAVVQVCFFRHGKNEGTRTLFYAQNNELTTKELLREVVIQFYTDNPPPAVILLSEQIEDQTLLTHALAKQYNREPQVIIPSCDAQKRLTSEAVHTAKEVLNNDIRKSSEQDEFMVAIKKAFFLPKTPKRIEIYDISHIQGTNAVGVAVCAGPEGFIKRAYRKFNIKMDKIAPGDDCAMLEQVVTRRFQKLRKKNTSATYSTQCYNPLPDLLLVDGGKCQLKAVYCALTKIGLEQQVVAVGIAKGSHRKICNEVFYLNNKTKPINLDRGPLLYFIQKLRNEAHRFAISAHIAKRDKAIKASVLDTVPGIGPIRKRALLTAFGSIKSIQDANLTALMSVQGISTLTATIIKKYLQKPTNTR